MRKTSFIAAIILAPLSPSLVLGDIRTPDCVELADWARTLDFDAKRQLNPYTTYAWLEDFLGPRMVELYGKSAADFTEADADAAAVDVKACGKTLEKADRRLLGSVEKQFDRVVGPIAKVRDASLAELDPAMAAFAATHPGLDKLRMIAAMRAIAAGDRSGATAAASGLSREGGKVLDAVLKPMMRLPLDLAGTRVMPEALEAEPAAFDGAMAEISAQYAALEASERTLQRWDASVEKIERPLQRMMTPEIARRLEDIARARRGEIEVELTGAQTARLETMGSGAATIAEIDRVAAGTLMRQLSPEVAEAFRADLAARRQALALALVAEVPIGPNSLAKLPELEAALTRGPEGLVSDSDAAALRAAIATRQAEAAVAVAAQLQAAISATPFETGTFAELERLADPRVLAQLAPADADATRAAAQARRDEIGEKLSAMMADELNGLDEDEEALAVIDTALLPGVSAIPASAGRWREELLASVVERRNAILAAITYDQRGSLEDRVYMTRDRSMKVEFRDDEAYVTDASGQTLVVAYEEVDDAQVKMALPQATILLTREGRWLVGGPVQLQRIDDAH